MQESAIISGLVQDIRDSHQEFEGSFRVSVEAYWQCGKLLCEAKKLPEMSGNFELWVESNFDFTTRTARNYMEFFRKHVSAPLSDLQALKLTDGRERQSLEGDVTFDSRSTGLLGVVNRFDREWTRWEKSDERDEDKAREVFRPVWQKLQALFAD